MRQAFDEIRLKQSQKQKMTLSSHRSTAWPTMAALSFSEAALIRAARRLSAIHTETALVVPDLERLKEEIIESVGSGFGVYLGPQPGMAAAAEIDQILCIFCCAGYRPLRIGAICEPHLSVDERFLLSFVAACQADDAGHVGDLLSWLLPPAGVRIIVTNGHILARLLQQGGLMLPQRLRLAGCSGHSEIALCPDDYVSPAH
ncbi:MAG: hypothetical protein O3B21_11230 [Proteobacteria bacterium]|nr:hypothetical protein [Pseudomonadota bacterium]MDA1354804.1 hypothetical protein [Pseudomonadota bacterium]